MEYYNGIDQKNKEYIDGLSMSELLEKWRFAQPGDPWMQGDTGKYWQSRMVELRSLNNGNWVSASKSLGW